MVPVGQPHGLPQAGGWAGPLPLAATMFLSPALNFGPWVAYVQIKHSTREQGYKSQAASLPHTANSKGCQDPWEGEKDSTPVNGQPGGNFHQR